ncbi:uncharacterized protein K444DRAFT_420538 [Hyaloscypha bicolor E]|uniref:Uncharacterized protein n=1 Tax=Hyaloscypha bicolor E TaxID=1095630 RepID=A0A2J6T7I5_9HELO|nr:uncharacterized protein K444DRAFT_420538 [Hyaloscypha bicolor E]PMD58980.1 hypothetical protein K444DRAFT_420538 [Hyaloscypha bicolor E]
MTKSWCFSSERPMVDRQPGPRNLGLSLVVCPTWYCISTAQTVVLAKRKFPFNGHGRRETQGDGSSARPRTESQSQERAEVWQTKFEPTENQRPWKFRPPASPIFILPTRGVKGKELSPLPTGRMVELALIKLGKGPMQWLRQAAGSLESTLAKQSIHCIMIPLESRVIAFIPSRS